jgi:FAD/FMN-containing dehydrogenase
MVETAFDTSSIDRIWNARKSALNQIMKLSVGSRKPIGLIEDTVVHPSLLSEHTRHILDVYSENELDYVMYGHVGNGNIHTRPIIDIQSPSQVSLIDSIADDIFGKVISNGGTITGEHGDGISRSKYIPSMYGQNIYTLFKNVKKLFDPKSIMNPGKKISPT